MLLLYTTVKLIILYLVSIALWGIDKFHSILFEYGWWKPVALIYCTILILFCGLKTKKVFLINLSIIISSAIFIGSLAIIIAYLMGYVDTFLGAIPLKRLRNDDIFKIVVLGFVYLLLKIPQSFLFDNNKENK